MQISFTSDSKGWNEMKTTLVSLFAGKMEQNESFFEVKIAPTFPLT